MSATTFSLKMLVSRIQEKSAHSFAGVPCAAVQTAEIFCRHFRGTSEFIAVISGPTFICLLGAIAARRITHADKWLVGPNCR
jgi:hypothetical protein